MNTKIPRDIEGHPFFERLTKAFGGRVNASFVSLRLWCELGYQVEIHGQSGVLDVHEVPSFCHSIAHGLGPQWTTEAVMKALIDARLIEPHGEHYFCQIFSRMNPDLDLKTAETARNRHYLLIAEGVKKTAKRAVPLIAGNLWEKGDGTRFLGVEMNEIVLLIKTIDRILHVPDRKPAEFDSAMIQDAYRITNNTPPANLTAILKRLYKCRSAPGVPRTTPLMLKNWSDMLPLIAPEDGWKIWGKRENIEIQH